jgi:hypothetical protein
MKTGKKSGNQEYSATLFRINILNIKLIITDALKSVNKAI